MLALPAIPLLALAWAAPTWAAPTSPAPATPVRAAAAAPGGPQARLDITPDGRLPELETWMDRFRKAGHRVLRGGWRGDLTEMATALRAEILDAEPERRDAVLCALLDLAGIAPQKPPADQAEAALVEDVRGVGRRELERELRADPDEFLGRWFAHQILARPGQHPRPRVLATLRLLDGRHLESTQLALFSLVLNEDAELRRAAVRALVGWPSPLVDEYLAGRLESLRERGDDRAVELVQAHFADSQRPPSGRTARELLEAASAGLASPDWREAVRTLDLSAALPDGLAVPALIQGLRVWLGRREQGLGRVRVEAAIVEQLERRSGRRMGLHPDRWQLWWKAVLAGEADTASMREAAAVATTRTTFFGLRPETDRVVFVIDRSRSMSWTFGTSGRSRFDAAIGQLTALLEEMGPETRFRVVLFDDEAVASSRDLRGATSSQVSAVRRWMRSHGPRGGTVLRGAIEEALRIGRDGRVQLDQLEADTVIVLCDGETQDGIQWIAPLLETANARARMVFHCVQIGGSDNGALETLATLSGGRFVQYVH